MPFEYSGYRDDGLYVTYLVTRTAMPGHHQMVVLSKQTKSFA